MSNLGIVFFPFPRKSKEDEEQTQAETGIMVPGISHMRTFLNLQFLITVGNWARGERNMVLASNHELQARS